MSRIVVAICIALFAHVPASFAQSKHASPTRAIAYESVSEALAALRAKSDVKFSKEEEWLIAKDTDGATWSFSPPSHPAHPSVGRRQVLEQEGRFFIETRILCQSTKAACDKLHADYQLLDQRINEAIARDNRERARKTNGR